MARLRAALQGPSASLHWDELPDLVIPTDPNQAFNFFFYTLPSVCLSLFYCLTHFLVCFTLYFSLSASLLGDQQTS